MRIVVDKIRKRFGTQVVLDSISFEIPHGRMTAIVGPSGTGKSVLLKIMTGLLEADKGDVRFDGFSIRDADARLALQRSFGILFQGAALFDSMTLIENVVFPLRERRKYSLKHLYRLGMKKLTDVGLEEYAQALPGEVSIGIRKRAGIARALAISPKVLFFDEPNTSLDPLAGQEIYDLIHQTHLDSGFTGVVVSHELPEVFQVCSHVIFLYNKTVQFNGSVEQFISSENPMVQQFLRGERDGPMSVAT
jgi:phospholipid/cholesterol/gamma-HCH transport system ATP-binding protein